MNIRFADGSLAILLAFIGFFVFLETVCGGWTEGSMNGTCAIPLLTSAYNSIMGMLLIAAFTGILWLPFLLGFFIICYVLSTLDKIRNIRAGGWSSLAASWFGSLVWGLCTGIVLFIVFAYFIAIALSSPRPQPQGLQMPVQTSN